MIVDDQITMNRFRLEESQSKLIEKNCDAFSTLLAI